ncbi:MAG: VOC family protein [Candidatus Limnocylindria bacterium]
MTAASAGGAPREAAELDHLVVTSATLEAGVAWVEQTLGVSMQAGGEHPRMGTHNAVLRLGRAVYLEVIAPDPAAAAPGRPRMFALDTIRPDEPPRLATWVARTPDIRAAAAASLEPLGAIEPLGRGSLRWLITISADGSLPGDGLVPALIEWLTQPHPALAMADSGCVLDRLEAFDGQPDRLELRLRSLGLDTAVAPRPLGEEKRPYLVAHVRTPEGLRLLGAPVAHGSAAADAT